MTGFEVFMIWIVGSICTLGIGWGCQAFFYSKSDDKEHPGFSGEFMIPIAALWPVSIPIIVLFLLTIAILHKVVGDK